MAVPALLLLACGPAWSAETADSGSFTPQVWLSPGIYSEHFDRSKNLRNDNPGLTVEVDVTRASTLAAGSYINSNRARTHYAAYAWQPLQGTLPGLPAVHWKAGALLGAFDGYPNYHNGGWFAAPLPLVSLETRYVGLNMSVIPTIRDRLDGALSFQFKVRIW